MDLDSGAGLLHRLTAYDMEREWHEIVRAEPRLHQTWVSEDPDLIPPPMKTYRGRNAVALPRNLPDPGVPMTAALAGHPAGSHRLDAAHLGRVLFLGAGVTRVAERGGREVLYRASGSAGGRFPLEVYASTRGVAGVADGVYWYDPLAHALVPVGPAAGGGSTTLVVTGVPWRTGWRYAERGWRHLYWDAGTLLSQLTTAAASAGLEPRLRTLFPDEQVRALVGADGGHEYPLALLSFGDGEPAISPRGASVAGGLLPVELPLCTEAQRAGDRHELGVAWPEGPGLPDAPASASVDEVVRCRGSQRRMNPERSLPRSLLEWPLRAALRGIEVPHWIVVHRVDGVPPGAYRYPYLRRPVRPGNLQDELVSVCLDQPLAGDAAYVVIAATALSGLDDRSYRHAQLAAGMAEGRLHLAAYALGASASGMTFVDSAVPALLNERDDLATLLFTCVGVPAYVARRGGTPGSPTRLRIRHAGA